MNRSFVIALCFCLHHFNIIAIEDPHGIKVEVSYLLVTDFCIVRREFCPLDR